MRMLFYESFFFLLFDSILHQFQLTLICVVSMRSSMLNVNLLFVSSRDVNYSFHTTPRSVYCVLSSFHKYVFTANFVGLLKFISAQFERIRITGRYESLSV